MLKIEVSDSGLVNKIRGLGERLRDLRPVWGDVHTIFIEFMKQHFKTEGAYVGQPWVPLNPRYAAWKARMYPGQPILRLTDRLFESLTEAQDSEHVFNTGPTFAEIGTRNPVAWYHQSGTRRGLPKRTVIPRWTKREGTRIVDAILAFILRSLRGGSRNK